MAGLAKACHPSYVSVMDPDDRASTTMNVSLPKALRTFVEERIAKSAYTSASEYVRELIRQDRDRQAAQERLEKLLLDGVASGPASEWTDDEWTALRRRVAQRLPTDKSAD